MVDYFPSVRSRRRRRLAFAPTHLRRGSTPSLMFLARSLERGGAERQLVTLAVAMKNRGWPVSVACFYARGPLRTVLEAAGVRIIDLEKRGRWDVLGFVWRLIHLVREEKPDIVHSYLPMPNLCTIPLRVAHRDTAIVWGVRASSLDGSKYDWLRRMAFRLEAYGARFADLVIANSRAGFADRVERGVPRLKMRLIPNGIDTAYFRFDLDGRRRLRKAWHVSGDSVVVGIVGRLDPMKGHSTFLRAASILASRGNFWRFVCVGDGPAALKAELMGTAEGLGLSDRLQWVGARDDMPAVYSALDISVSASSFGEGFPNVIGESMACGRPCVVTDVGDSSRVVGDNGIVVPPEAPMLLAAGIERLRNDRAMVGALAGDVLRARVQRKFSVARLARETGAVLLGLKKSTSAQPDAE